MKPVSFLLVDDLEENLIALEALLRREGLQLLKATTGDRRSSFCSSTTWRWRLSMSKCPGSMDFNSRN